METGMASRSLSTRRQTSPPLPGRATIAILVVVIVIVVLNPAPALVTACASLALAAQVAARSDALRSER
jgi:hypothetical protein